MADVLTTFSTTLQSGAAAVGNGTEMDVGGLSSLSAQVSGTFVGTITWEATINDSDWVGVFATNVNTQTTALTATTPGIYQIPINCLNKFRARVSAYTSGQITVKVKAVEVSASLGQTAVTSLPGVAGDVAHDAVDSGSPLKIGGKATTSLPTAVSDGDRVNASFTTQGQLRVSGVALSSSTDSVAAVGSVAHDAADSGSPLKVGGRAVNAEIAAVANNDRSDLLTDLVGKLLVLPYANPENFVSGKTAAITNTSDTAVIAAAGAGVRLYITSLQVVNSHASTSTEVVIKDGTTELLRVYADAGAAVAARTVHLTFPVPLRLTANTALNAACVTTSSNVFVAAQGYKGA